MADLTRADLIDRVLEHLGVKPAQQSASAADARLVGEALDSQHARLRARDLAPFELDSIPPWAQIPLRDLVSLDVAPSFGIGAESMQLIAMAAHTARQEIARARLGDMGEHVPRPRWF